ncbi:MAG TPA: hypothetical protein VF990_14755 [Candidatus Dormibacteraeota bacterium]
MASPDPIYFNTPGVALVTWNEGLKAACVEMQGWASTSEAQVLLDAIIQALKAHHGSRWLLDARKMKVLKQSDQDWITQNWLPRAAAAGLKLAAIVLPMSMVTMTNVEDVAKVAENGIDTRFFPTVEKAGEWLTAPRPVA